MKRFLLSLAMAAVVLVGVVRAESLVEFLDYGACIETQVYVELYTDSSMQTWVSDFYVDVDGPGSYALLTDYVSQGEASATHYAVAYYWHNSFYCGSQVVPTH
jgi:hypothetical protein